MLKDFTSSLRPALVLTLLFALLLGLAYPAIITAIAQALFPRQANGSLVRRDGKVIGSGIDFLVVAVIVFVFAKMVLKEEKVAKK